MPAEIMLVGEGPGKTEDEKGRPFIGKTGDLLNMVLRQAQLNRDDLYVTNLVKYRVPDDGDPSAADIQRDAAELRDEIKCVRPRIIAALGRHAARYFLGDIDLEWAWGLPFDYRKRSKIIEYVVPLYHPAYALYSPEMLPFVQDGFHQLRMLWKGQLDLTPRVDEYPKPKYSRVNKNHIGKLFLHKPVYIDTEGWAHNPWCLSFTQKPGEGRVILARDKDAVAQFAYMLAIHDGEVVLFNAMHDLPVLRAMGIEVKNFRDLMVTAYHLCLEPQGLKPLARRHASMEQDSYDDVISDARRKIYLDWLRKAATWANKRYPKESRTPSKRARKKASIPKSDGGPSLTTCLAK